MLAVKIAVIQDSSMSEKFPVSSDKLQEFYNRIAYLIESDGYEPQMLVREWNEQLFEDMRSEAEVLMLMYGQGVSDRYLYGLCSTVTAVREENGGELPLLTDAQYEIDKEIQYSHSAASDDAAAKYFSAIQQGFDARFPITLTLLGAMEHDLRSRHHVPDVDIEEGFRPGWYKAVKVVAPLFIED